MDYEDVKRIRENPTAEMDTCDIYELQRLISEAIEKQIPKKPIRAYSWKCPVCKNEIYSYDVQRQHFCSDCGQRIDWSECGARMKGADND